MRKNQFNLRLDDKEVEMLRPIANKWGVSLQGAIRRMIREHENKVGVKV